MYTPENITELQPNERFVFGSNLSGNHAGGAARTAHELFGAEMGVGRGLTGQCYAFPTLDANFQKLSLHRLEAERDEFYHTCIQHPDLTFLLTRVGTGIAGYPEETIKQLFRVKLSNVTYPEGW